MFQQRSIGPCRQCDTALTGQHVGLTCGSDSYVVVVVVVESKRKAWHLSLCQMKQRCWPGDSMPMAVRLLLTKHPSLLLVVVLLCHKSLNDRTPASKAGKQL
jgi:hypothetical protein